MLAKVLFSIAGVSLAGAALLGIERQRLLTAHAMSDLHVQMDQDRKATWDAQARIAEASHPVALREAIQRIGLELEPLPTPDEIPPAEVAWPVPQQFQHAPLAPAPDEAAEELPTDLPSQDGDADLHAPATVGPASAPSSPPAVLSDP